MENKFYYNYQNIEKLQLKDYKMYKADFYKLSKKKMINKVEFPVTNKIITNSTKKIMI